MASQKLTKQRGCKLPHVMLCQMIMCERSRHLWLPLQAWRAFADRTSITSRNSNYHEEFQNWLKASEYKDGCRARYLLVCSFERKCVQSRLVELSMLWICSLHVPLQEKYTQSTFKSARALRNKLVAFGVLAPWEKFFAENVDFLNEEIPKPETVLQNMNAWATLLENRFSGQNSDDLGKVLVELSKFCDMSLVFWYTSDVCESCDGHPTAKPLLKSALLRSHSFLPMIRNDIRRSCSRSLRSLLRLWKLSNGCAVQWQALSSSRS